MIGLVRKIFGSKHEKDVKALRPLVDEINQHFEELQKLSDDEPQFDEDTYKTTHRWRRS